jgi:hypothetical protein
MADIDLNDADEELLAVLEEGRNTPSILADRLDYSREYVAQRLKRLVEHQLVVRVGRGLYGLPKYEQRQEPPSAADRGETAASAEIGGEEPGLSPSDPQGERAETGIEDAGVRGADDEAAFDLERALDEVAEESMPGSGEKQQQRREALRAAYEFLREADGPVTPQKFQDEVYPGHEAGYTDGEDPPYSWWTNCIYGGLKALAEYDDAIVVPDTSGKWEYRG